MSEEQAGLFDEPDMARHLPARERGSAHVLTRQQMALVEKGHHPLSLGLVGPPLRLHPIARFAGPDEPIPRCGTCVHRRFLGPGRPKCFAGSQQQSRKALPGEPHEHGHVYYRYYPRARGGVETDVERWFPACPEYREEQA